MKPKSPLLRMLYLARSLRSRALFRALRTYCRGKVLDVGGWDFYLTARDEGARFDHWTTLESSRDRLLDVKAEAFEVVYGDGCNMEFASGKFDTVINIQVLEHVFEPIRMVEEMARVLRTGGHGIFLIPQTATTHLAPDYHYNFSRYWIEQAMERAGLEIVSLEALGGIWSSMASHLVYFFVQAFRVEGFSDARTRRNPWFYALFPLMVVFALVSLPICMLLSLGDLGEEPNNHLVVVKKAAGPGN